MRKHPQEMVVSPRALKSSSKEMAGMPAGMSFMRIYERASTEEIFLSRAKRLNKAMA